MKYRIAWKSKKTNHRGVGNFVFTSLAKANNFANKLNRDFPGIAYWVEVKKNGD